MRPVRPYCSVTFWLYSVVTASHAAAPGWEIFRMIIMVNIVYCRGLILIHDTPSSIQSIIQRNVSKRNVLPGNRKITCPQTGSCGLELETKVHPKVCNHGEGPYLSELPRIIRLFDYSNSWDRIVLFDIRYSLILR